MMKRYCRDQKETKKKYNENNEICSNHCDWLHFLSLYFHWISELSPNPSMQFLKSFASEHFTLKLYYLDSFLNKFVDLGSWVMV